ncbi:MAG: hypothetical protein WC460_00180 [Patescibacteria group bacterium]
MDKKRKILSDCPLEDKTCDDCDQQIACRELAAKRKISLFGRIKKLFT